MKLSHKDALSILGCKRGISFDEMKLLKGKIEPEPKLIDMLGELDKVLFPDKNNPFYKAWGEQPDEEKVESIKSIYLTYINQYLYYDSETEDEKFEGG